MQTLVPPLTPHVGALEHDEKKNITSGKPAVRSEDLSLRTLIFALQGDTILVQVNDATTSVLKSIFITDRQQTLVQVTQDFSGSGDFGEETFKGFADEVRAMGTSGHSPAHTTPPDFAVPGMLVLPRTRASASIAPDIIRRDMAVPCF